VFWQICPIFKDGIVLAGGKDAWKAALPGIAESYLKQ
jgi:hypothetical protein